jgi:pimeloyl-ACP methyl ester carboxylesterase
VVPCGNESEIRGSGFHRDAITFPQTKFQLTPGLHTYFVQCANPSTEGTLVREAPARSGFPLTQRITMGSMSARPRTFVTIALCASLAGCMFQDVREQQARMAQACTISGSARAASASTHPIVVILVRRADPEGAPVAPWQVVDYFVLQQQGAWRFTVGPGTYRAAAFEDANADVKYQPGEPFAAVDPAHAFECVSGNRKEGIELAIPATALARLEREVDVREMQAQGSQAQLASSLGQLTAVGEIASLTDPRFSREKAESSLWRPFDFIVDSHPGIYFLEPYDERKIPVLFVHGITDTPASFSYLIERLDRTRFQPWVYSYPSGAYLSLIADHLTQTMSKLEVRYGFKRFALVAHSMGGLVSRGFILRHARASPVEIPLFVTISTPWSGHESAEIGVKLAPAVVDVWRDMVPGSEYLRSLFATSLPPSMEHDLIFTYSRKSSSFGVSDDHTVTVASQLDSQAQQEALHMYGIDDTHIGVLQNPRVAEVLNKRLAALSK